MRKRSEKGQGQQIEKLLSTHNEESTQFRNKSYDNVKQCILKTKGVDIGNEFN